ncbi:MAG: FAD-dependent oxidoreductase [Pseudomonadota bacterium]
MCGGIGPIAPQPEYLKYIHYTHTVDGRCDATIPAEPDGPRPHGPAAFRAVRHRRTGRGPAGIAAAATASEAGHNTRLIERLGFCGGAAVCGMSGTICGLYNTVEAIRAPRSRNN